MFVISIKQIDNGVRYLALSDANYQAYHRDPTMIDSLSAEACLDVANDGMRYWQFPHGCKNSRDGKNAIRAQLKRG